MKEITADGVIIQEKGDDSPEFKIPADLVILTSGTAPSSLVSAINWLPKDKSGRIRVSRTLQVAEHPSVFALGDCAAVEGVQVPATAQVAMQQTDIVARNIASMASGVTAEEALQKFKFVDLGQMLTLGGSVADGAVTSFGGLVKLQGPLAAVARRGVYAVRMPTSSQRLTAAFSAGAVSVASLVKDTTSFLTKKTL